MFSSLLSKPKVSVTLVEDQIYVHPSILPDTPTRDPIISGTALIQIPSRRAIKQVKITLEGLCDVMAGDGMPYQSSQTMFKELILPLNGEVFEQGRHAFNFSFIIRSSSAPYQRSQYGRCRTWVKAVVDFEGRLSGSITSPSVAVYVAANPCPPGEAPEPTNIYHQHLHEDLGPVGISFTSPFLTVASLLNVGVDLLGPPSPITILSVNGSVSQSFEIQYNDGKISRPAPRRFVCQKVEQQTAAPFLYAPSCDPTCATRRNDGEDDEDEPAQPCDCRPLPVDLPLADPDPLKVLQAGEEFHYVRTMRVPKDDYVRPTTLEGTDTSIRVSHVLQAEIVYRKEGSSEEFKVVVGKPVTIASCCCFADSLFLPAYSKLPPQTITRPSALKCYCNMSLEEMYDRDGAVIQRAGVIPTANTERYMGLGRVAGAEDKSPAFSEPGTPFSFSSTSSLAEDV